MRTRPLSCCDAVQLHRIILMALAKHHRGNKARFPVHFANAAGDGMATYKARTRPAAQSAHDRALCRSFRTHQSIDNRR